MELQKKRNKPEFIIDFALNSKVNGLGDLNPSKILDK